MVCAVFFAKIKGSKTSKREALWVKLTMNCLIGLNGLFKPLYLKRALIWTDLCSGSFLVPSRLFILYNLFVYPRTDLMLRRMKKFLFVYSLCWLMALMCKQLNATAANPIRPVI